MPRKKPQAEQKNAPEAPAAPTVASPEPTTSPAAVGTDAPATRRTKAEKAPATEPTQPRYNKVRSRATAPKGDAKPTEEQVQEYDLSGIGEDSPEAKEFAKRLDNPQAAQAANETEAPAESASPEAEKPTEQTPAPQAPKHSPSLLSLGREFGLTDAEMAQVSEEELSGWIRGTIRASKNQPQAQPQPAAPKEPEVDPFENLVKEYGDDLIAPMKSMHNQLQDALKIIQELKALNGQREAMSAAEQIDAGFAAVKNTKLFGEGPIHGMKQGDPHGNRRVLVVNSLKANPIPGVPLAKAVEMRAKELFAIDDAPPAPAVDETPKAKSIQEILAARKGEWKNGTLAAPTQRETDKVPGRKGEVQRLGAALREAGLWNGPVIDADGDDELAGLPD